MLSRTTGFLVCAVLVLSMCSVATAINLTGGIHTEDFDSMGTGGTAPPTDWTAASSAGSNPPSALGLPSAAIGGIGNNGYNAGTVGGADRALGVYGGASGDTRFISATFTNQTGSAVSTFDVNYDLETWYWRFADAANGGNDRSAGFNLVIDTGSGFRDVGPTFDTAVTNAGVTTDGGVWLNSPTSSAGIGGTIDLAALNAGDANIAASIAPGGTFSLGWNATSSEPEPLGSGASRHGVVSVDNFSIDFNGGMPPPPPPVGANILVVTNNNGNSQPLVDFLEGRGHTVLRERFNNAAPTQMYLDDNQIDLVIVARESNSGDYDDGSEPQDWNGLPVPMINANMFLYRTSRWGYTDNGGQGGIGDQTDLDPFDDPNHPFFAGLTTSLFDAPEGMTANNSINLPPGSQVLATLNGGDDLAIFIIPEDAVAFNGRGTFGDIRVGFNYGNEGDFGLLNANGREIFARIVDGLTASPAAVPEPTTGVVLLIGVTALSLRRRRRAA